MSRGRLVLAVTAVGVLVYAAHDGGQLAHASSHATRDAHAAAEAATAVDFAKNKIGDWYLWGGNGPDVYDCSGLVKAAWAKAGVTLPRRSQEQWAQGHKIPASQVHSGDLVFFAGGDGTTAAPGHVGIVYSARRHLMIEAYASGTTIRISVYGSPTQSPPGDADPVGFTDPAGGAR